MTAPKINTKGAEPAEATKAEKFVEIANRRTAKVIDAIDTLGNLANPTNYDYTPEQWNKIFEAVIDKLNGVKTRVENPKAVAKSGFSL